MSNESDWVVDAIALTLQAMGWLHAVWSLIVVAVAVSVVLVLVGLLGMARAGRRAEASVPASDEELMDVAETVEVVPHAKA